MHEVFRKNKLLTLFTVVSVVYSMLSFGISAYFYNKYNEQYSHIVGNYVNISINATFQGIERTLVTELQAATNNQHWILFNNFDIRYSPEFVIEVKRQALGAPPTNPYVNGFSTYDGDTFAYTTVALGSLGNELIVDTTPIDAMASVKVYAIMIPINQFLSEMGRVYPITNLKFSTTPGETYYPLNDADNKTIGYINYDVDQVSFTTDYWIVMAVLYALSLIVSGVLYILLTNRYTKSDIKLEKELTSPTNLLK